MSETHKTAAPPEGVDRLENARAIAKDARNLFRRSRAGVPGMARLLAESLELTLAFYDAAADERDELRARMSRARAALEEE